MSNQLKPGLVISMRVNPADCMSVVDVLAKTGLLMEGMSFSGMCSLAFSSLLETVRQQEHIPRRSGFEFTEMVGPFLHGKHAKKVHTAKIIQEMGSDFSAPALPTQEATGSALRAATASMSDVPQDLEHKQAARRLTELLQKRDLSDQGSGVVWQQSDQHEFDQCYRIVYPTG